MIAVHNPKWNRKWCDIGQQILGFNGEKQHSRKAMSKGEQDGTMKHF